MRPPWSMILLGSMMTLFSCHNSRNTTTMPSRPEDILRSNELHSFYEQLDRIFPSSKWRGTQVDLHSAFEHSLPLTAFEFNIRSSHLIATNCRVVVINNDVTIVDPPEPVLLGQIIASIDQSPNFTALQKDSLQEWLDRPWVSYDIWR